MILWVTFTSVLMTSVTLVGTEDVTSHGVMWQVANVRADAFGTATEELTPGSELLCAAEANKRPWCSLYCYQDQLCSLYSIKFPATQSTTAPTHCKTNIPTVECTPPFAYIDTLEDLGCIYMSLTTSSWNASREDCYTYQADLFSPVTDEQHYALKTYYYHQNLRNYKWVGVIGRLWISGQAVTVWNGGEPNGPMDMCGIMQPSNSMDDTYCSSNYEHVCQANSTF